jgi:hypothetical protein
MRGIDTADSEEKTVTVRYDSRASAKSLARCLRRLVPRRRGFDRLDGGLQDR